MKRCRVCNMPLILAWIINGWPWEKRVKPLSEATHCKDTNTVRWEKEHGHD